MPIRITIIEDSKETINRFLIAFSDDEAATKTGGEFQPITVMPFFDKEVEEAIQKFNPDLIILDLRLVRDVESGFRVLRQLKTSEKVGHVPVVVCSRCIGPGPDDANKQRAISMGAVTALPKIPFPKPEEFLRYATVARHEG